MSETIIEAQTSKVVMRRKVSQVDAGQDFGERRSSRPDSCHKGNLKRLKTSSLGGFQRWEKENELLWAMLEDETEWLEKLFPDIIITPDLFFYALEDGVVLCRLANLIQETSEEFGKKNNVKIPGKMFKFHRTIQKKNKQLALFKSRENVQGFLTWCRQLGISDSILFESNDIVEADECREGCREVVICLMEIARRAAARFKFTPIPKLIQLEKEIEAEEREDAERNVVDHIDYGSTDEDSNDSGHSPGPGNSSLNSGENGHRIHGGTKQRKKAKKPHPKSELDKEVFKIIDNFNVYNIRKIKEGKYLILGKIIFVRMLNGHVLLRIGGGWDTLEHYLLTHIPKAVPENGHSSSELKPSVSKTPQKPQLSKLLDKVKKATPVSSPSRAAATKTSKQQDDSSDDDEKDITSAIRKIEFSVNQNIATRRKHSKVLLEVTPEKTNSTSFDVNEATTDVNQNSLHGQYTPERQLNETPQQQIACSNSDPTRKMEDEASRTESGFFDDVNVNGEPMFGEVEQNGGDRLMGFQENGHNGSSDSIEHVKSKTTDCDSEGSADVDNGDVVDGALVVDLDTQATPAVLPYLEQDEAISSTGLGNTSIEEVKSMDPLSSPPSHDGDQVIGEQEMIISNSDTKEQDRSPISDQLSAAELHTDVPDTVPSSSDNIAVSPIDIANDSEKQPDVIEEPETVPIADDGSESPERIASPVEKKLADSPKKKAGKNGKEPLKAGKSTLAKNTVAKTTVAKKNAPVSTSTRPKTASAKPSARPTSAATTAARNTKRPTSALKPTTTSSTKSALSTSPLKASKASSTSSGSPKKSETRSVSKTSPSSRTARPAVGFGSSVSKPKKPGETAKKPGEITKKPGEITKKPGETAKKPGEITKKPGETAKKPGDITKKPGRPATAPGRTSQGKGRTVPSKVQSGLPSSRPHSAKPGTRPLTTTTKDTPEGGASKGTGKASKDTSTARATSPTKPLVRKTQTKTVTTVKTTKKGAVGEPEVQSQIIKTRTITEANGKRTTKTTMKEVSPPGRKPLRITKTETSEANGAPGKKMKTSARTEKPGSKETKSKVGSRVGSTGPSKTTGGLGTKKPAAKTSEGKVSSHLKNTMPKKKTVKELSNALGITTPSVVVIEEVNVEVSSEEQKRKDSPDDGAKHSPETQLIDVSVGQVEIVVDENVDTKKQEIEGGVENQKEVLIEINVEKPVENEGFVERQEGETPSEEIPVEQVEQRPVDGAEDKYVEQAEDKPIEQAVEIFDEQVEDKPVEQAEDKPVEQAVEIPDDQVEEQPVEQVEEQPVEQVEEQPVEQVEDQPVEQVEDQPVEQVEDQPVEQVEDQPVEQAEDKPVEQAVEIPDDQVEEQPVEQVEDQPVQQAEDKPVEQAVEIPDEQVEDQPVEQVEEQPVEQAEEEPVEQAEEISDEQVEERPVEQAGDKPVEQAEEQHVEQAEEQHVEQVEEKPDEQAEERNGEQDEDEPVEQVEDKPVEQVAEIPDEPTEDKTVEQAEDEAVEEVPMEFDHNVVVNGNLIKVENIEDEPKEGHQDNELEIKEDTTLDVDLIVEGLEPHGYMTTEERIVSESHVIVESSEISEFPEKDSEFPEKDSEFPEKDSEFPEKDSEFPEKDSEFPEKDSEFPENDSPLPEEREDSIDIEEHFDDSLDLIHVPPEDVSTEVTKIESTVAWPAIDDESVAHVLSEKTGEEEQLPEEEEEEGEYPVDPHAYQPFSSVFLQSSVDPEKELELSDGENNNLVEDVVSESEKNIDPDMYPAHVTYDESPMDKPADQSNEGSLVDVESESSLDDNTPLMEFQDQSSFQENRKGENSGAVVTVDDLLY